MSGEGKRSLWRNRDATAPFLDATIAHDTVDAEVGSTLGNVKKWKKAA
jgi:hypothetical protein